VIGRRAIVTIGLSLMSVAAFCAPAIAHAKPSEVEQSMAQVLFEEGRTLLEKNDVSGACERFARSQQLDPAGGTLLNLALCHEREGRLATAWIELHDALEIAMRDARADRESLAREHIDALGPRLPRVVIRGQLCATCEMRLDDHVLDRAVVGVVTPVDPGEHRLIVRAASGQASGAAIATIAEGQMVTMELPDAPSGGSAAPPAAAASAAPSPSPSPAMSSTGRTAGLVLLGTGAVALGASAVFGVRALSLGSDADAACPSRSCSDARGVGLSRSADASAWVANIALGTAVVAGGIGAYLFFTSKTPSPAAREAMVGRISF